MKRSWFAGMVLAGSVLATSASAQVASSDSASKKSELLPPHAVVVGGSKTIQPPAGEKTTPLPTTPTTIISMAPAQPQEGFKIYGGVEYLLWWMKGSNNPVLATQGNPADTPSGALDQPGTVVLFGGERSGPNPFHGGRFKLGLWLDDEQTLALEGNYFFLIRRENSFSATNNDPAGANTLNVPFFNADGNFEDAFQLGIPGRQTGTIAIRTSTRLEGAELNLRSVRSESDTSRISLIGGFRYLALYESLDMEARADFLAVPLGAVNTTFTDSFQTRNRFYGAQIGVDGEFASGNWMLNVQGKVAIGGVCQRVNIAGTTTNIDPINGTIITPGGLFSAPTNSGQHERSRFAVVPEVAVNLGYQLNQNWTATVGYTFLYVSSVARPGDQIDRGLNFAPPAVGPQRPQFGFQGTDFWAQGVNFGLQFRY